MILNPFSFIASIISFVVYGLPQEVSLVRPLPPVASRVFPRFQPATSSPISSIELISRISPSITDAGAPADTGVSVTVPISALVSSGVPSAVSQADIDKVNNPAQRIQDNIFLNFITFSFRFILMLYIIVPQEICFFNC